METELEKELILQHGRPADCGGSTERERSEESRVGKDSVCSCRSRWSTYN